MSDPTLAAPDAPPQEGKIELVTVRLRIAELLKEGQDHISSWRDDNDAGHTIDPDPECCACDDIFGQAWMLGELLAEVERLRAALKAASPSQEAGKGYLSIAADIAPRFVIFYVAKAGWASTRLNYHEGVGPYFSLPEALRRAEQEIGEMAWRPLASSSQASEEAQ